MKYNKDIDKLLSTISKIPTSDLEDKEGILKVMTDLLEMYVDDKGKQTIILESLKILNDSLQKISRLNREIKKEVAVKESNLTDDNLISFEEYESIESQNKQNEIQYISHDWGAFVYGRKTLLSRFGSFPTTVDEKNKKLSMQIKPYKDGKYVFQYIPNQLFKSISPISRGAEKWHILSFILTKDELSRLAINDNTVFELENGNDLLEEIIKVDKSYDDTCNMPKIKLPLFNGSNIPDKDDVLFANIIFDFFKKGLKYHNFSKFYSINVSLEGNVLNILEFLNLVRICQQSDYDFTIISNREATKKYYYDKVYCESFNTQFVDDNESFFAGNNKQISKDNHILINSYEEDMIKGKEYTFCMDVKDGFCSKENLIRFYNFVANISRDRNNQFVVMKEVTLDKIEELYQLKFNNVINRKKRL